MTCIVNLLANLPEYDLSPILFDNSSHDYSFINRTHLRRAEQKQKIFFPTYNEMSNNFTTF